MNISLTSLTNLMIMRVRQFCDDINDDELNEPKLFSTQCDKKHSCLSFALLGRIKVVVGRDILLKV